MTITIAVVGLKGGSTKSTTALALATTLADGGARVLLVDADPQGTLRAWARAAAARVDERGREASRSPTVVSIEALSLRRDLARAAASCDYAIIDTPPRLGSESRAALVACDYALLPLTPSGADLWTIGDTIACLKEARALREIPGAIVLNRFARTTITAASRAALSPLGLDVLSAGLSSRVAFAEALTAGLGIGEYEPGGQAAFEARRLTREVVARIAEARGVAA